MQGVQITDQGFPVVTFIAMIAFVVFLLLGAASFVVALTALYYQQNQQIQVIKSGNRSVR